MGDYNYRGKLGVGWHRHLLYCEGEVHIAINTGIRKKLERNLFTTTELDTINSQEAVLDIFNLIETLLEPPTLKR